MANAAVLLCLLMPVLAKAADHDTEQERVKAPGDVLKESFNGTSGVPVTVNKTRCDLFKWGTDQSTIKRITSAADVGPSTVQGITCEHYAC